VVSVGLPAHSGDHTAAAGLTLTSCRDKVLAAINVQLASQVILVGHNLPYVYALCVKMYLS
jgi:hypothetical protein